MRTERQTMRFSKAYLVFSLCTGLMVVIFSVSMTLGRNLKAKIMNQGTEGNMIVVQEGAYAPMFSALSPETCSFIRTVPHIERDRDGPLVSQCLVMASLISEKFTMVRGVDPVYFKINGTYHIVEGHLPKQRNEIIVGTMLSQKINRDLKIGDAIHFEDRNWKICGIFKDPVSVMGSGIVTRIQDLQDATNRTHISFIELRADSSRHMEAIKKYIEMTYKALLIDTPDVPGVEVYPEVRYFRHQADAIDPLIMFINLVNILYLLAGTLVMNNAGHYIFLPPGMLRRNMTRTAMILEVLSITLVGSLLGIIVTYLIGRISINFMFMTFFLKSGIYTVLEGVLLSVLLAIFSTLPVMKKYDY
jgi:hypothetical protein